MHALTFLWLEIFSFLLQKSFGPWLWTSRITFLSSSIDKWLLKLNIWCVTWKTGKPAKLHDVCCFCLSAGIHLTSTTCGVSVCQDGVWCISSLLGSNQTRGLKAFPPARLLFWRGDVIIHQEPKPSSSGPRCNFHRLPSVWTTYACRFGWNHPLLVFLNRIWTESSGSAGAVS